MNEHTKDIKHVRMDKVEQNVVETLAKRWGMNFSATVRRIIRERGEIDKILQIPD